MEQKPKKHPGAMLDELPERQQTAEGILYRPQPLSLQWTLLIAAFAGGPCAGWLLGKALGVTNTAQLFLYVPATLIFFLGYGLWSARLAAIAFDTIGRHILWVLLKSLLTRRRPPELKDALPGREKLAAMAARAQKASSSFFLVAVPIAAVSALAAPLLQPARGTGFSMFLIGSTCLLWGWLLSVLARRGYLPMPEGE